MKTVRGLFVPALWLFLLVSAQAAALHGPVVVILLPGTSLTDWRSAAAPTLHHLLDTGAVAVMNTRTARLPSDRVREAPESACLTLGAGSRAVGGPEVSDFQPEQRLLSGTSCTSGQIFTRRTLETASSHAWVNTDWARVAKENQSQGYDLLPGNLGDALRSHNITPVIGGGRFAFPVACASDGTVTDVITQGGLPHPLPACLIWDAGSELPSADTVIANAATAITQESGTLLILSPFVGDLDYAAGRRLAPVIAWGPNIPPGLIYSPSTHRAGLVANTDFAPTVTALLGATAEASWLPAPAFGHAWEYRAVPHATAQVSCLEDGAYRQSRAMRVLPALAVLIGLLVLGSLLSEHYPGLRVVTWLPIIVIFSLIVSDSLPGALLWIVGLSVIRWLWKAPGLSPQQATGIAATLVTLTLTADMLTGDSLMRRGMLGYSAVEGARYYGIGNEAMGPLIGSALVLAACGWPTRRVSQIGVALGLTGIAALFGLPAAGAKAGGLLVAVASFAAFLWTIRGRRWTAGVVAGVLALMALTLFGISLSDLGHRSAGQTHIGQGVKRIRSGGLGEAADIITRKLTVEARLAYHSAWAVPLWTSVVCLALIARRPLDGRARALLYGGFASVGSCLVLNDAGVVAGALCGSVVVCGLNVFLQKPGRPQGII